MELAQVIVRAAHPTWTPRLEMPVAAGDARAADLMLLGPAEVVHVEVERALVDFQAQLRAAQRKRDELASGQGRPIRLVIAVPDTTASRARLAPFADLIGRTMTRSSRQIWAAIRGGKPLGADGILFVRMRRTGGADEGRR